jgi:hypothetical protein
MAKKRESKKRTKTKTKTGNSETKELAPGLEVAKYKKKL